MTVENSSHSQGSFEIVSATWRDLNALRSLEKICFPKDAWPLFDLIGVLTLPAVLRLKAVVDERMVGFLGADVRSSQDLAWIATIGVLPEYRNQGIGSALIRAAEEQLDVSRIRLSVRASNETAIRLYMHLGYKKVGVWSGYYQDGENAWVMEKQVGGEAG